jgi:hypothetical protein
MQPSSCKKLSLPAIFECTSESYIAGLFAQKFNETIRTSFGYNDVRKKHVTPSLERRQFFKKMEQTLAEK